MLKKKDDLNYHADQLNSNNTTLDHNNNAYKSTTNNRANQLNPNNNSDKRNAGKDGKK